MVEERRKKPKDSYKSETASLASSVGVVLLELHNALGTAERCRVALRHLGYSQKRWQEIVKEVDPGLRFVLRPQALDAIITHLQSAGEPINRTALANILDSQGAGPLQHIKRAITVNLRNGNLKLLAENKIGLPTWTNKEK